MRKTLRFLGVAARNFRTVGAVVPSSPYVARKIAGYIKSGQKYIVEYGAGNGVITKQILKMLPRDGRVVAIELNQELSRELLTIQDPRLMVLNRDVFDILDNPGMLDLPRIDVVISGIPFSFFENDDKRRTVVAKTEQILASHGRFVLYQTNPVMGSFLAEKFRNVFIKFVIKNFPPYFIIVGDK